VGVRPTAIDKLVAEALAIENEAAAEAGALGFMARALVQATLPHRAVKGNEFVRTNGRFTLSLITPTKIGLPYGNIPRLLVAWLATEAVRTREREFLLGENLSGFMRQLGLVPTGGRWGSITRLKDQARRLFNTTVTCSYEDERKSADLGYRLADKVLLWWDHEADVFAGQGTVRLTEPFFEELIRYPVPVDMRAIKALKRSPLALDIYCWLTYRMFYLRKPIEVPWPALQAQFGADYGRERDFRAAFNEQLRKVVGVYPDARVEEGKEGLMLRPSRTHIVPCPADNPVDRESYPRINGSAGVSAEPSAKPTAARVSELRAARGKKTTHKRSR
jgi:hypothetical protein